jgi:hypothetical protein
LLAATVIGPGKKALLPAAIVQSSLTVAGHSNPLAVTCFEDINPVDVVSSNVRLASPSSSVVVEPIVVNLLAV